MPTLRTLPTVCAIVYALSQLQILDLKLKDWQQQAIHAVYDGNDIFFCQVLALFVIKSFLSFLTIGMAYLVVRRDVEPWQAPC